MSTVGLILADLPEFAPNGQAIPAHVHPREDCSGACPFHNPSAHSMAQWPFLVRLSALVERTCPHGVGHPDPDSMRWMNERTGQDSWGMHGCDGCCSGAYA